MNQNFALDKDLENSLSNIAPDADIGKITANITKAESLLNSKRSTDLMEARRLYLETSDLIQRIMCDYQVNTCNSTENDAVLTGLNYLNKRMEEPTFKRKYH